MAKREQVEKGEESGGGGGGGLKTQIRNGLWRGEMGPLTHDPLDYGDSRFRTKRMSRTQKG